MRYKISIVLMICVFSVQAACSQSPWTRKQNEMQAQISINMIPEYEELYSNHGDLFTERKITDLTLQLWLEYGIFENSTLIALIPFKSVESTGVVNQSVPTVTTSDKLTALGTSALAWRQNLYKGSVLITGQFLVEIPTAAYDNPSGLRTGYDAWSFIPTVSIGQGSEDLYGFGWLSAALRSNHYSSYYRIGMEAGYQISDPIWLGLVVEAIQSMQNGSRRDPANNLFSGLYVNNQEYISWGLKAFGNLFSPKWGVSAALFGAFSGNFVAKSPSINLGLYYNLN